MAVELSQLRIWNWIIPNDEKYWKSEFNKIPIIVDKNVIQSFVIKLPSTENYFDYIELTPKLLEKFGFRQSTAQTSAYIFDKIKLTKIKNILILFDNECIEGLLGLSINSSEWIDIDCKYLHNLQNLFHALTGIELNDIVAYEYYKKQRFNIGTTPYTFEEFICANWSQSNGNDSSYTFKMLPPDLFA